MAVVALQFRVALVSYRYLSYFLSLAVVFISISMTIAQDIVDDIRSICENVRFKHPSRSIHKQLVELIDFTNHKGYYVQLIFTNNSNN